MACPAACSAGASSSGGMASTPMSMAADQDSPACYELAITGGLWMATSVDPGPPNPFDGETPLLQIPAQFQVIDSAGRFGGQTTRPIGDSNSVFPHSRWSLGEDSLQVSWGTGFVGWSGRFGPAAGAGAWTGHLYRFWDNHLGEPRGWWRYDASIRRMACPGPTSDGVADPSGMS